ncbi:hypothetical protein THASP1DRAFT_32467 [Thamnocephalis sphaerospora]|uniref:F-box domain-containing protein n=1 Tax=Thamnocephalis sphaerospora TaxID=78915 RepID=A0A4P9XIX9_9FUNG|nr:hypothetical protein THASP1DRAFT_32467 [Thamnocephalis sphaerospora]|eukprot:RKP05693.1 hypothetical protein THASP1DRAFT_32467 [Thamnocephalis sphaerospora]
MDSKQTGHDAAVQRVPMEIWLLLALHTDAIALLRLCAASRILWHWLSSAQHLWQQVYHTAYSEEQDAEIFWLAAYRQRVADSRQVDAAQVDIHWRRAVLARMRTETNWRLGRYTERSCLVPTSQRVPQDWKPVAFRPSELLLKMHKKYTLHTVPVTSVGTACLPSSIMLHAASPEEQATAQVDKVKASYILLRNRAMQDQHTWILRQTGGPTRKLARETSIFSRHGRWLLAYPIVFDEDYNGTSPGWTVLDLDNEYPAVCLKVLNTFSVDEYATTPGFRAEKASVKKEAVPARFAQSTCIVTAHKSRVVICAAYGSKTVLYWKVVEVLFRRDTSADHACGAGDGMHGVECCRPLIRHTCHSLEAWSDHAPVTSLFACALGGGYVWINGYHNVTYAMAVVIDTQGTSGTARLLNPTNSRSTLRIIQHGWRDSTVRRPLALLPHRQLFVARIADTKAQRENTQCVHLLRCHDGTAVRSYDLPIGGPIEPVLGDLVIRIALDSCCMLLFDMFAGTTIRMIHDAADYPFTGYNIISPLYNLNTWQQEKARPASEEERIALSLPQQYKGKDSLVQSIRWFDYMPDVS